MKSNLLRTSSSAFSLIPVIGLVLLGVGFSLSAYADTVLPAVGPRPSGEYDKVSCGYLKVYSATEASSPAGWSDGDYYYPHSSYSIYAGGKKIKSVTNHGSFPTEGPETVDLPPGTYTVKAWSDKDGLVTVPVIIKLAQTTSVHLENGRVGENDISNPARAVKSPSGQVVGWKA